MYTILHKKYFSANYIKVNICASVAKGPLPVPTLPNYP
jgi:hypothetical protein